MKRTESLSAINTFMGCHAKYNYKYNMRLSGRELYSAPTIGQLVHAFAETRHGGPHDAVLKAEEELIERYPDDDNVIEELSFKARCIGEIWDAYWNDNSGDMGNSNLQFLMAEHEWRNGNLVGKGDGYLHHTGYDKHFYYELKTASRITPDEYISQLQLNNQIDVNINALWLMEKPCDGVFYDIIWKPLIRKKKGEEDEEFEERYLDCYRKEPEKYFDRVFVFRTEEQLIRTAKQTKHAIDMIDVVERDLKEIDGEHYRNTDHCKQYNKLCQFHGLCMDNNEEQLEQFGRREYKHPELSNTVELQGEKDGD